MSNYETNSITYEYAIAKALYDSPNRQIIENEIQKIIYMQIDLINAYYSNLNNEKEKLEKISNIFFKDYINEQGQIGKPLIKIQGTYKPIQTLDELKNSYIPSLNFREKMSMLRNFQKKENDCIMFSILVDFNFSESSGTLQQFKTKYPMLNIDYMKLSVQRVENIIGFDINETGKCYDTINGVTEKPCRSGSVIPLYEMVQNTYFKNPKKSPITLCWLWHPLVYGTSYQDVLKLQGDNYVKDISVSYSNITDKNTIDDCMKRTYSQYPIFPPLSEREQKYMRNKGYKPSVDGTWQIPPYTPPVCTSKPIEPNSFYINLQKKYNKYYVSNLSGHVMLFILISNYFNNVNINSVVLAGIMHMVPYNHSIHEVFQAAKLMNINNESINKYSIKKDSLSNMNSFLQLNNLSQISIPENAPFIPPKSRGTKNSSGGRKKTKHRKKHGIKRNKTLKK